MKILSNIAIESAIVGVRKVHDYFQFLLKDSSILSIYKPFIVNGCDDIYQTAGLIVIMICDFDDKVNIILNSKCNIVVIKGDTNNSGPEAVQLNRSNLPTIVWR